MDDIKRSLKVLLEYNQPKAPGGQVKGREKAKKTGKGHPFRGRLVGEENVVDEAPREDSRSDVVQEMHMLIQNFKESILLLRGSRKERAVFFDALKKLDMLVHQIEDQ